MGNGLGSATVYLKALGFSGLALVATLLAFLLAGEILAAVPVGILAIFAALKALKSWRDIFGGQAQLIGPIIGRWISEQEGHSIDFRDLLLGRLKRVESILLPDDKELSYENRNYDCGIVVNDEKFSVSKELFDWLTEGEQPNSQVAEGEEVVARVTYRTHSRTVVRVDKAVVKKRD